MIMSGRRMSQYMSEEEKQNAPKVTGALLSRIFSYLKPYWLAMLLVFIVILAASVVGLLPSIITGKIIDTAIMGNDMELLVNLVLMAIFTLGLSQVIGVLESYINSWISNRIVFDMKNEMFQHLQKMPHTFFTTEKQGDVITRMNSDITGVSSVISGSLTSFVSNVCVICTTVVALWSMNHVLALTGVLVIPLLVLPTRSAGQNRWKLLSQGQGKRDEMNDLVNETLSVSGSLLVKLFSQQGFKDEQFNKVNEEVTALSIKEARAGRWFRVIMGIFTNLGPLLIYLVGGYLMIVKKDPTLSVGAITATVNMINRLYRPVESLLNISVDFTRSLALFTRIFDYLDKPVEDNGGTLKPDMDVARVEYEDVVFGYDAEKPILKSISFDVDEGKMMAIVGPSGSGKSTIVNLLPRLYDPQAGKVTINGIDVRDIDLHYLRQQIGVVTQEAYLFNGTIRDNLRFGKPDATEEEMIEACKIANIHDFIVSTEKGYDTQVGNRGLKLSGGEKQRISLARVILKDPQILILDEATSALDSISEAAIQQALDVMMNDRTSIVIAHRLSTILAADEIMVVKDGYIAEQGDHETLLALGGIYTQLYETQFRRTKE